MHGVIALLKARAASWLVGFDVDRLTESQSKDMALQILETRRDRLKHEMSMLKPGTERFREGAVEVAQLEQVLQMLSEGDVDGALGMLQSLMADAEAMGGEEMGGDPEMLAESSEVARLRRIVESDHAARLLESELAESGLPDACRTQIRGRFADQIPTLTQIRESVAEQKDLLAKLSESGQVVGCGRTHVSVGTEERERWTDAMSGMFRRKRVNGVQPFASLHESYRVVSGFSGSKEAYGNRIFQCLRYALPSTAPENEWGKDEDHHFRQHQQRVRESANQPGVHETLREALTTSLFAEVYGDSVRRSLVAEYGEQAQLLPDWRAVVSDIVPLEDFRTRHAVRVGGFDDLSTVAENTTYPTLDDVTDEEATYTPAKRGGVYPITWESVVNDDLSAVVRLIKGLARSATRTLSKHVLNTTFTSNPTIYDSGLLIASAKGNHQTAALSDASLEIAITQMLKIGEQDSAERLGLRPHLLVVPPDLHAIGLELTRSSKKITSGEDATIENQVKDYWAIELLINTWQTDANDWFLVADPRLVPTIEVGFLGGREEPELFVADAENIGSMMSSDTITHKVRHVYGAAVLDYRGFQGSLVT